MISNKILDSELNRKLLAGTEFDRPINSLLWLSLFLNSSGYYINRDKDYLLFHDHEMKMHEGKLVFEKVFDSSQKEWKIVSGPLHNRKGQTYGGFKYRLDQNEITVFEYGDDLGTVNLSLLQRVEWSAELLIKFQDYFSWDYLSQND